MHDYKIAVRLCLRIENVFERLCLIAMILLSPSMLLAQVIPSARGGDSRLLVGGEYSYFKTDFPSTVHMQGLGAFADFHFTPRLGVEGETRFLYFDSFHGENEKSYLIGPKIYLRPYSRLRPFGKFLFGQGSIKYPFSIGSGSYFAYASGGGIDYRVKHNWFVRAEYEYQFWPSAPGISGQTSKGLKPNGVSIGIAYQLF
jgi:opacity protein-like surface antigen